MGMIFYILMAIFGCWPLVAKAIWRETYTWGEVGIQLGGGFAVVFLGWHFGIYSQVARTEIWNGEITGKEQVWVSCSHSYQCNCRQVTRGTGKDATTTTECDTCYEHHFDYDWEVYTSVGNFEIPRIDRQGVFTPPRWAKVQKGQPAAREHTYTNYVAASKQSLFNKTAQDFNYLPDVPKYPRVFDYHYANRVLPVMVALPDLPLWQTGLAELLKELGPKKQANITVVIAGTPDQNFRHKVEAAWEGGNKNDVVVLIGVVPESLEILWADVITFGGNIGNEALAVSLRNTLLEQGTVDRMQTLTAIGNHVRDGYNRPQMKDFEYLKHQIEPTTLFQVMFGILLVALNIGVTIFFHRNDWHALRRNAA